MPPDKGVASAASGGFLLDVGKERDKETPLATFVVALGLLATGVVALPVGLVLLIVGEWKYGILALLYGIIAVAVAMFGSEKSVRPL